MVRFPAILLVAALLTGCASSPGPIVEPTATLTAPAGLIVRAEVHVRDTQAAQRFVSGVYLLEPDGTLRVDARVRPSQEGPMVAPPNYPPILRRLSPSDVDRIWRIIGPSVLAEDANPERVDPRQTWTPDTVRSTAMIEIRDHNGTRRYVVSLLGGTPTAIDARQLIERLQALAWRTPKPTP
ncbi:MAG: hypothetical protein KIT54_05345 [Phycisphaeraceae bacterium]|nr:hypothetical protein [Phycisphaeraceae bacterium]